MDHGHRARSCAAHRWPSRGRRHVRTGGRAGVRTILAVDGGNSKTDVAIVAEDGRLLAAVRGETSSHQAVGLGPGMERLAALIAEAVRGPPRAARPDQGRSS